jgi:DNA-binding response OmpR family regulator
MRSILLCIPEPAPGLIFLDRLAEEGYRIEMAADGEQALERGLSGSPDVVLLDVALPGSGGFHVCLELRRRGFDRPLILLGDRPDAAPGLKLGADDFLVRPLDATELAARMEACLRRGRMCVPAATAGRFGGIEVDARGARVLRDGREVPMSPREYQLLRCLVEHAGTALSRDELLDRAWGREAMPTPRTVDVHVAWLRRKLEADPRRPTLIRTVHGVGYRFESQGR